MTDYNSQGYNYHSKIITVNDDQYLVQGQLDDPLTMFRPIDELLECERDQVQKKAYYQEMLEDGDKE